MWYTPFGIEITVKQASQKKISLPQASLLKFIIIIKLNDNVAMYLH